MDRRAFFFLFLFFPAGASANEITIRTCLSRGAAEYFSYLEEKKIPNPVKNLLQKVAKDLHVNITFEASEIYRCLKHSKDGTVDAIYPLPLQKESDSPFVEPPASALMNYVKWNVYTLTPPDDVPPINTLKNLKGPLGIPFDFVRDTLSSEKVTLDQNAKTPEDLVRQLLTKRVSAILLSSYEFAKTRASFKPSEISKIQLSFTYAEDSNYFLLTKKFDDKHPGLSKKIYTKIIEEKGKPAYRDEIQLVDKILQ